MGVVSRKVVPACGNICFICPSMRARSRQPVKRYKKMLSEIFPKSQDAGPDDRKIGKLCDYVSKNPLRIPKITDSLEQKCYKELRNENFGSVKVVICIYRKMLSSCKEQMPLFASSLLGIVRTLLEQNRQEEMQILGCNALVDFINCQTDSTHIFSLEGFIPKLCQLAQEVGDDERALRLRSAGLQALAYMVLFMGEHSHISMDFDNIISVTLENYVELQVDPMTDTSRCPSYWSSVCLSNMARLAKEATTVRRVLEPLFLNFDAENRWSPEKGTACSVLAYLQSLLQESGEKPHLLLSILVKHLDHKNVAQQPDMQVEIVRVIAHLSQNVKEKASLPIVGAISDLIKRLRKCLQYSAEASSSGDGTDKWDKLQFALEECISQLSRKVGDVGPILDMIAVVLESISNSNIVARTTISAVYRVVQNISTIPNITYQNKVFPDALFHQLLLAMAHPDHETRIRAQNIFSVVLVPTGLTYPKVRNLSFSNQDDTNRDQSNSFMHMISDAKTELNSLRLSSHQVNLLLSSIWIQATSPENTPSNFEAMAHTYYIALLFTRSKQTSSHVALVRCFQLAFSLRIISLDQEGGLQYSRRRSLFTLASYMLLLLSRACYLLELIPTIKASLSEKTVDPFLQLVNDMRLQARSIETCDANMFYGSEEDENAALKCLSTIEVDDKHLKEAVISHFMTKYSNLSEDELSGLKKQLLQGFSPDDGYPLGVPLFMETPMPCSPHAQMELQAFDEMPTDLLTDEDTFPEPNGSQSDRKSSLSTNSLDILNVSQLLESVLETARQVASYPPSSTPIPYDQMKTQCEALVLGKHRKMEVLQSFKHSKAIVVSSEELEKEDSAFLNMKMELSEDLKLIKPDYVQVPEPFITSSLACGQYSFRLPPSSPYDKFMKAAGC